MMYKWKLYLKVQLKRVGKALPGVCLLTVILTVSLLILLKAMFLIEESQDGKQVVRVGVVGDLSDTYLGIGINVIKNMESIESMVDIRTMTQQEAREQFADGEISAYLLIPNGFVDSIITGENKEVTYVTTKAAQGIGGILINELVGTISQMVTLTQNSVQAMQIYLIENDMREHLSEAVEGINYAFIGAVLNRMDVFELQELGVSNSISIIGHLFSGILMLLMLLWGINCVSLMVREDTALLKLLRVKGVSPPKQVSAEVLAYCILQCVSLLCVFVCVLAVKTIFGFEIREWDALDIVEKVGFIIKLIPVVFLVSSIQVLLYELVTNVVTGVLLQFVVAVSMAYISGCLYPLSFFPDIIQKIGMYSPIGAALRYVQKELTMQNNVGELVIILLYIVLFVGLQVLRRNYRITKE